MNRNEIPEAVMVSVDEDGRTLKIVMAANERNVDNVLSKTTAIVQSLVAKMGMREDPNFPPHFRISIFHFDECPAVKSNDFAVCTCKEYEGHVVPMTIAEAAVHQARGDFDVIKDLDTLEDILPDPVGGTIH